MSYKMHYLARRAKNVAWEDWPRTWKSHAVFASQFPAMDGTIDWMRYNTRVDDPRAANLPVSTEHDGVSSADSAVHSSGRIAKRRIRSGFARCSFPSSMARWTSARTFGWSTTEAMPSNGIPCCVHQVGSVSPSRTTSATR